MLIGEYTHTIDDKNRVSLPSKFRKEMGKKVVITPGFDNCLFVFAPKEWKKISDKLASSSVLKSDSRSLTRVLFGGAVEAEVDSLGRILVPDFLKTRIALGTKAVMIGVQSRVEIWNESTWLSYKAGVEKNTDALAEKLGELGVL
jgi:MraZ protein